MLSLNELQRATSPAMKLLRNQLEAGHEVSMKQAGSAHCPQLQAALPEAIPDTLTFSSQLSLSKDEALQLARSTKVHRALQQQTGDWSGTAVSSELYVTFDGRAEPLSKTKHRVIQVSIAGINWAYPQASELTIDGKHYVMESDLKHCERNATGLITESSLQWYQKRMQQKWGFVLEIMAQRGVQIPVLPALGLGAFLPNGPGADQVRLASIAALNTVLAKHTQHGTFTSVWVSVPGGGNLTAFQKGAKESKLFKVTQTSMFDFAHGLADQHVVGIVNASDREALLSGNLGQYWAAGHVALEEIFPYVTTMLLNNWCYTRMLPAEQ